MNTSFNDYILRSSDRRIILWKGVDNGGFLGKFSFKPTHAYVIFYDEAGQAHYRCLALPIANNALDDDAHDDTALSWSSSLLSKIQSQAKQCSHFDNIKSRWLVSSYRTPERAVGKGVIFGLMGGFFLTVASILTSMILGQIALDEEKQEEIHLEAQKAIAMCSATQSVSEGDFAAAEKNLDEVIKLDPSLAGAADNPDIAIDAPQEPVKSAETNDSLWSPDNSVPGAAKKQPEADAELWSPKS